MATDRRIDLPKDMLPGYIKERVRVSDSGCWEWIGHIDRRGYGFSWIGGKSWLAHRLSYFAFSGDPFGLAVCHKCDNRKCCNPDHLFAGSQKDNMLDMRAKGRQAKGLRCAGAKLKQVDVDRIIEIAKSGRPYSAIAREFGVSMSYAAVLAKSAGIKRGVPWLVERLKTEEAAHEETRKQLDEAVQLAEELKAALAAANAKLLAIKESQP